MINIPASVEKSPDAYKIRRLAIDNHVPIITNIEIGKTLLKALLEMENDMVDPKSWQEFMEMND
jgi:type III secretory pathway component EscU